MADCLVSVEQMCTSRLQGMTDIALHTRRQEIRDNEEQCKRCRSTTMMIFTSDIDLLFTFFSSRNPNSYRPPLRGLTRR